MSLEDWVRAGRRLSKCAWLHIGDDGNFLNGDVVGWRNHFMHIELKYPTRLATGERAAHAVVELSRRTLMRKSDEMADGLDNAIRNHTGNYAKHSEKFNRMVDALREKIFPIGRCIIINFLKDSGEECKLMHRYELTPTGEVGECCIFSREHLCKATFYRPSYSNPDYGGSEQIDINLKKEAEEFVDATLDKLLAGKRRYLALDGNLKKEPTETLLHEVVDMLQEEIKSQGHSR